MEYYVNSEGRWVVNLCKRQLASWYGHSRPKSEVIRDPYAALAEERDIYRQRELTICGLSGRPLEAAQEGGGTAWRGGE